MCTALPGATAERDLRGSIALGDERTIQQDPAFALRIMVDIAIRALSPAVNDPTTAVQVINHLGETLRQIGSTNLRACTRSRIPARGRDPSAPLGGLPVTRCHGDPRVRDNERPGDAPSEGDARRAQRGSAPGASSGGSGRDRAARRDGCRALGPFGGSRSCRRGGPARDRRSLDAGDDEQRMTALSPVLAAEITRPEARSLLLLLLLSFLPPSSPPASRLFFLLPPRSYTAPSPPQLSIPHIPTTHTPSPLRSRLSFFSSFASSRITAPRRHPPPPPSPDGPPRRPTPPVPPDPLSPPPARAPPSLSPASAHPRHLPPPPFARPRPPPPLSLSPRLPPPPAPPPPPPPPHVGVEPAPSDEDALGSFHDGERRRCHDAVLRGATQAPA